MNVEIGTEAAQFPDKEYINGIFVGMHVIPSPCVYRANVLLFVYVLPSQRVIVPMCYYGHVLLCQPTDSRANV
jgi:hypothetical protein